MKKLLAVFAAAVIGSSLFTGCSNKKDTLDTAAPPPSADAVPDAGAPNKPRPGANAPSGSGGLQGALGPN